MNRSIASKVVFGVSVILILLVVFFQWTFATHAGGLWRDEVNTIGLATMPRIIDVWHNQQFDSYPMIWPVFVRLLWKIGIASDMAFRYIGFVVCILNIVALWLCAREFKYNCPVLSIVILCLSPSMICWGGSMRAYGLGVLTANLVIVSFWVYIRSGGGKLYLLALLSSLAGVHSVYYNSIVVFACSIAGVALLIIAGRWNRIPALLSIGGLAAVTLLPALPILKQAAAWNDLVKIKGKRCAKRHLTAKSSRASGRLVTLIDLVAHRYEIYEAAWSCCSERSLLA